VTRVTGDLQLAEDTVQEACAAAVVQWAANGIPESPLGWLVGTARHKAIDTLRREGRRVEKEAAAVRELEGVAAPTQDTDELGLVFMCCHPALDEAVRVALTLRAVCGLSTAEVAGVFLVPEATMAKRPTRARAKIRDTAITLRVPGDDEMPERLAAVLKVVYLTFTEGHAPRHADAVVREDLCDTALDLARALAARLPREPEVDGLLALLLLTDARRAARVDDAGEVVLLDDQDRTRWDHARIAEGVAVLERAERAGRPGPYQLQAAIAECHSCAGTPEETDWRRIAVLYGELLRHESSAAHEANRAVAVAMSEGPAAGLVILDALASHPQLASWIHLHVARADLLARLGRTADAAAAYGVALELEPARPTRNLIERRLAALRGPV
jgi:RNA polymerase sigma-70 factor, ECF subfamily